MILEQMTEMLTKISRICFIVILFTPLVFSAWVMLKPLFDAPAWVWPMLIIASVLFDRSKGKSE